MTNPYEQKIHSNFLEAGIRVDPLHLGSSNVDPDICAYLNTSKVLIEAKANKNAQMGGTSWHYDKVSGSITPVNSSKHDELISKAILERKAAIDIYLDNLGATSIPLTTTKDKRSELKASGLQAAIESSVAVPISFLIDHYNKKGIYYIQIGGQGLFFMGSNPHNLPIPEITGEMKVELRLGYGGGKPTTSIRSAGLRVQGRLKTFNRSPYTLDVIDDIKQLFITPTTST